MVCTLILALVPLVLRAAAVSSSAVVASSSMSLFAVEAAAPTISGSTLLQEIIEILVSGIVPIAKGIGQGLSELVQYLFLQTVGEVTSLSVFGTMVIIFAGIALAIGLSRWVLNFITSLGSRNR